MIKKSALLILSLVPFAGAGASDLIGLETAMVENRTIPREYRLDGIVEAVHRSTVSSQIRGRVESIHYDVDEYVEKGTLLVKLKDSELQAGLARAEAERQSATAQLNQREEEFQRAKGMFKKKLVSASAMDQATADFKSAQGRYGSALAALEEAREKLSYTEIRAPHPGLVTERHVEVGEVASPGQPLISGISLDSLRVIVDVPQSVMPALRKSGQVRVRLPNDKTLDITDITASPIADHASNSFRVRVTLPKETKELFPGMFVKVSLITGEKHVLVVPKIAVVNRSEVTGIYILKDDGRIRFRRVRVGRDLGDHLVVLAGLSAGERAAIDPYAAVLTLKRGLLASAGG